MAGGLCRLPLGERWGASSKSPREGGEVWSGVGDLLGLVGFYWVDGFNGVNGFNGGDGFCGVLLG